MSDAKKISLLARKVLEVPTSLEINFNTIKKEELNPNIALQLTVGYFTHQAVI